MTSTTPRYESPALWGAIKRAFGDAAVDAVGPVYAWVVENGGAVENTVLRTPGTSFNPRPARVALIALGNGLLSHHGEIAAALLATVPDLTTAPESWGAEVAIARSAQSLAGPIEGAPQAIALSLAIDTVRHLHLTSEGADRNLEDAKRLLALHEKTAPSKLTAMLAQSIEQQTAIASQR